MNGHQLQTALEGIFGDRWRKKTRDWLGISESTLARQVSGRLEVQGPVKAAVEMRLIVVRYRKQDLKRQIRSKYGKVNERQYEVLQLAAAGIDPHYLPPTPVGKIVGRKQTIVSCIWRGFMNEDLTLTDLGRKAVGDED